MFRTYEVKAHLNKTKEQKVRDLFKPYRQAAKAIGKRQWRQLFEKGDFNKHARLNGITSPLSERYKETIQYQVIGVL